MINVVGQGALSRRRFILCAGAPRMIRRLLVASVLFGAIVAVLWHRRHV